MSPDETNEKEKVAEITTWKNNCAVSCTAVFLVNAFLSGKLSEEAETRLTQLLDDYYGIYFLSTEQLRDIFSNVFILPSERQIILGSVLRAFLETQGIIAEAEDRGMLSNDAFIPLAKSFGFNVIFYANVEHKVQPSGVIGAINIPDANLTLKPYYHEHHFDLIMDDQQSAIAHNNSNSEISLHDLPIERGKEDDLRGQVKRIISERYHPQWREDFNEQLNNLLGLAHTFGYSIYCDDIIKLSSELQNYSEVFFLKPMPEMLADFDEFQKNCKTAIQEVRRQVIGEVGIISLISSYFRWTEEQKQLNKLLNKLDDIVNTIGKDIKANLPPEPQMGARRDIEW